MTNGDIYLASKVMKDLMGIELPAVTTLQVVKANKIMQEVAQELDDIRNLMLKKYGEEIEAGVYSISNKSPNWSKFKDEMEMVYAIESKAEFESICLSKTILIKGTVVFALEKFITWVD